MATKRILTFTTSEIIPVVNNVLKASEHRCNYGDMYRPEYHKGGRVKMDGNGFPDTENIDYSKIKPSVWVVKDDGVYVMSSAKFEDGQERGVLAYAHECNPHRLPFEVWYENARNIMGGDDSVESLPVEWFVRIIESKKPTFKIQITAKNIRMLP